MFRSNRGTHPVLFDLYPHNCINCGAPLSLHNEFPCPNRLLTPKELGKFRRDQDKENKKVSQEDETNLNDMMKGIFK